MLDWVDNPVTEHFKELLASYVEDLRGARGLNCYIAFEPQKTQESLAQLAGQDQAWAEVTDILEGNWMIFSTGETESDEYFRYISEGE